MHLLRVGMEPADVLTVLSYLFNGQRTLTFHRNIQLHFWLESMLYYLFHGHNLGKWDLIPNSGECWLAVSGHGTHQKDRILIPVSVPTLSSPRTISKQVYGESDEKQIHELVSEGIVQLMFRAKWIFIHLSIFTKAPRMSHTRFFWNTRRNIPIYFLKIGRNYQHGPPV